MSNRIELFDTTLRDGTQGEHVNLSARDKLRIARRLDAFGIDIIEGGWPGSNPTDLEFFERACDVEWTHASICAFGSTRRSGLIPEDDPSLRAMLAAGTSTVSMFGKSSVRHAEVALGVSREENIDLISSTVAYLKAQGRRVIYDAEHFFDGIVEDDAYALATITAAADAGADVIVLCDTNGGTLPHQIFDVVTRVSAQLDRTLGIHAHNDGGCATANSIAAVRAGARHVQGTINGLGERCGNADLCAIIPGLEFKLGYECVGEENLRGLGDLSRFVDEVANLDPIDNRPYVGRSAFAHKAGVHVSAVMKDGSMYEHMEPEMIGNRRRVLVSDLSGRSNVRYKAQELGLELDDATTAARAVERLKSLEHGGYSFEGAEASFELLVREIQEQRGDFFDLERFHVHSQSRPDGGATEAVIAIRVGEERELVAAEGIGPVDALSKALHMALCRFYDGIADVRLTDYKVRVLSSEDGTAAPVRVLVEHRTEDGPWHTVGVSQNILEASAIALTDAFRYFLLTSGTRQRPVGTPALEAVGADE